MDPGSHDNRCRTADRWSRWGASAVGRSMTLGNLDRARKKGNRERSLDASWRRASDPVGLPAASAAGDESTVAGYGGGGGETETRPNGSRWADGKKGKMNRGW